MADPPRTTVHLVRHGQVENPAGVIYGRLPGYPLSLLGVQMAQRVAEHLSGGDVAYVAASPLERARQTAAPVAAAHGLEVAVDDRLIEAGNRFQGRVMTGPRQIAQPRNWWNLRNPFTPSWGEPYLEQVERMLAAVASAREAARGRVAVCISHQLPIWGLRSHYEGRRLWHDPRRRECTLASVTSLAFAGDELVSLSYAEPARDLLPVPGKAAPIAPAEENDHA